MPRHYQNLADYAAIGIAPLLIWWMLNSLANFLMIVIYRGQYSWHVSWILMCYTMGATARARVTIEESREKASAYAVALGGATFYVMIRYVHDPIFLLAVILTIGYLADRIVHDCTIIDDGVDSSGQGLVDSVRKWFQKRSPPPVVTEQTTGWQPRRAKNAGHQPGKTVLYLAVGALPLFGIGQFFLDRFPGSWERAKWMLTLYLFTSLSLLVVTSFLNLRRYLRQRGTEMTAQVTVSWLAGGVGMIMLVLLIAYLAPLPGQTLVSFQMPDFLSDSDSTKASKWGFGGDGASESEKDSRATGDPRADAEIPKGAPEKDSLNQSDAKPGGDSGNKDDGPAGKDSGGKKPAKGSDQSAQPGKSEQPPKPNDAGSSAKSEQTRSKDANQPNRPSQPDKGNKTPQSQQQKDSSPSPPPNPSDAQKQDTSQQGNKPDAADKKPAESKPSPSKSKPAEPKTAETKPSNTNPVSQINSQIASLFKFILIAGLIAVIAVYVYLYRDAWLDWLNNWLNSRDNINPQTPIRRERKRAGPALRPFSSFANPVGDAEAGQVVVITFQALEAWGREQGVQRGDDETPSEYVRRLATQFPTLKQSAWRVVDAYNRVVYGRTSANDSDVNAASSVWQIMRPQL